MSSADARRTRRPSRARWPRPPDGRPVTARDEHARAAGENGGRRFLAIGCRERRNPRALTLEGDIVRSADIIGYVNHDIDDGIRAGVLTENDIPRDVRKTLGATGSQRIDRMVRDVIDATLACDYDAVTMTAEVLEAL